MSIIQSGATLRDLSMAAMEEASRFGVRTVDIEHLFLALVISDKPAGKALRGSGVTLDAARRAVGDAHAARLASLGMNAELPQGRIIAPQSAGHFDWAERARGILAPAAKDNGEVTSAVLRRLLDEPSGLIEDVLGQLGVSAAVILDRLGCRGLWGGSEGGDRVEGRSVGLPHVFRPGLGRAGVGADGDAVADAGVGATVRDG